MKEYFNLIKSAQLLPFEAWESGKSPPTGDDQVKAKISSYINAAIEKLSGILTLDPYSQDIEKSLKEVSNLVGKAGMAVAMAKYHKATPQK